MLRFIQAILFSTFLSGGGYARKSLNRSGAVAALFVGFITCFASHRMAFVVVAFFVSASIMTKIGSRRKRRIESEFKEGGQRNYVQVAANGLVGTLVAAYAWYRVGDGDVCVHARGELPELSWLCWAFIGHYACCNGDTWASELGTILGGTPVLVTSGASVPVGTNGGVSTAGTLASGVGGTVVGVSFHFGTRLFAAACTETFGVFYMQHDMNLLDYVVLGFTAGLFGSFVDSLLGATLQYSGWNPDRKQVVNAPAYGVERICGRNLLDNHQVNFLAALITAIVMPTMAQLYEMIFYQW